MLEIKNLFQLRALLQGCLVAEGNNVAGISKSTAFATSDFSCSSKARGDVEKENNSVLLKPYARGFLTLAKQKGSTLGVRF